MFELYGGRCASKTVPHRFHPPAHLLAWRWDRWPVVGGCCSFLLAPSSGRNDLRAEHVLGRGGCPRRPRRLGCWLGAYRYWGATERRALAERFDGRRFSIVPTPDRETAPAYDVLEGVAGSSSNDVWAVGMSSGAGADQTLIEHFDGHRWSIVPSQDLGASNDLVAVTSVSVTDAWAVGAYAPKGSFYDVPLADHFDGSQWSSVSVPNPAFCAGHSQLTAVTSSPSAGVWATGWCGGSSAPTPTPERGFVERWTGTEWTIVSGTTPIPAGTELNAITARSASDVWAVGSMSTTTSQAQSYAVHFNGQGFTSAPMSAPAANGSLSAVTTTSTGARVAVGAGASPQPPFAGPLTIKLAASKWRWIATPVAFGVLSGVTVDGRHRIWSVGQTFANDATGNQVPLVLEHPSGG